MCSAWAGCLVEPGVCCFRPDVATKNESTCDRRRGYLQCRRRIRIFWRSDRSPEATARPAGAVLGRNDLELPGDCVQARRSESNNADRKVNKSIGSSAQTVPGSLKKARSNKQIDRRMVREKILQPKTQACRE